MSSTLRAVYTEGGAEPGEVIISTLRLLGVAVVPDCEKATPTEQGKADLFGAAAKLTQEEFRVVEKHANRVLSQNKAQPLTLKRLKNRDPEAQHLLLETVIRAGIRAEVSFANDDTEVAACNLFADERMHRLRRSCVPNAHVALVQGEWRMEVRAMRAIEEGEEVVFCEGRPFCGKAEREERAGAEGCECVVCQSSPVKKEQNDDEEEDQGEEGEKMPTDTLYHELGKQFQVVDAFRQKFFAKGHRKDFALEDYTAVLTACEWIIAQTKQYNVVHACLAEVFETAYLARTSEVSDAQHDFQSVPRAVFDDKLAEMSIRTHCVGVQHEGAQRVILEAWVLAWRRERRHEQQKVNGWRAAFEEAAAVCGFFCDGWETFKILPFGEEEDVDAGDVFATKLAEMRFLVRCNGIRDRGARRVIGEACKLASRSRGERDRFMREAVRLGFFVEVVQGGRGIRIMPLVMAGEGEAGGREQEVEVSEGEDEGQGSEEGWEDEEDGQESGDESSESESDEEVEVSEAWKGLLKAVERG